MRVQEKPRALVCPLDWGLGHAARCVPIIQALMEKGFEVAVATSGLQASLIQKEIPQIRLIPLAGYGVRYSQWLPLVAGLIIRSPLYLLRYVKARRYFLQIVEYYKPSVVFSDNRPECFWQKSFNVYITHQLSLALAGLKRIETFFSRIHAKMASGFQEVWVPDVPDYPGLSGKLGHPLRPFFRQPVVYVGFLSRFQSIRQSSEVLYDVCFMLSGPEPERSRWEKRLLEQGRAYPDKKFALIRGTNKPSAQRIPENFFWKDHASSDEIQLLWAQSRHLVCRAGYSTLMDVCVSGRDAWIVPTPGQPEQEYLADLHRHSQIFYPVNEENFSLDAVLQKNAMNSAACQPESQLLHKALDSLLVRLRG